MNRIRKAHRGWLVAGLVLLAGSCGMAQRPGAPGIGTSTPTMPQPPSPNSSPNSSSNSRIVGPLTGTTDDDNDSPAKRSLEAMRANLANVERQKILTREAAQLLRVVAELHMKITNQANALTPEEMAKQMDVIEKLARDVKEKMKGTR